jgi:hypothetical protein
MDPLARPGQASTVWEESGHNDTSLYTRVEILDYEQETIRRREHYKVTQGDKGGRHSKPHSLTL